MRDSPVLDEVAAGSAEGVLNEHLCVNESPVRG